MKVSEPRINVNLEATVSEEGTGELIATLRDTFSPVSESLGLIGDQIRLYRVSAAIKTFRKAQEIAKSADLTLDIPPLKFLVPFIENCSLEDEADSEITEMWASLLVGAATEFKSGHLLFSRILKELTMNEAKALHSLANDARGGGDLIRINDAHFQIDLIDAPVSPVFRVEWPRYTEENIISEETTGLDEILRHLLVALEEPGISYSNLEIVSMDGPPHITLSEHGFSGSVEERYGYATIDILESLNLIKKSKRKVYLSDRNYYIDSILWYMTPLGAAFYLQSSGRVDLMDWQKSKK